MDVLRWTMEMQAETSHKPWSKQAYLLDTATGERHPLFAAAQPASPEGENR